MAEVSLGARKVLVHEEILCAGDGLYDLVIRKCAGATHFLFTGPKTLSRRGTARPDGEEQSRPRGRTSRSRGGDEHARTRRFERIY